MTGQKGCMMKKTQEAKADAGKVRPTLVPPGIIWAVAEVREFGMKKYKKRNNWKKVSKKRYRDATFRRFLAYLKDPKSVDEESGLPHLWHLVTNLAFLIELEGENEN